MSSVTKGYFRKFTGFKESNEGDTVVMSVKHWEDVCNWQEKLFAAMVMIHAKTTPPCNSCEIVDGYRISGEAISRPLTEEGFQERRRDGE